MWEQNVGDRWIDKALECVRSRERESRWSLAFVWQLPIGGHDLAPLYKEVREYVEDAKARATTYADMAGLIEPADMITLDATIEMLSMLDPSGDAFRYPTSTAGNWYNKLPHVSLTRFGELAHLLAETVRTYDCYFEEAYTLSTICSPWPGNLCGF